MFSLTNLIILLSWLLFSGAYWFTHSKDLSDKSLDKAGFSEDFRKSAKVVRKRFSRITWATIVIFSIFFFISIVFLDTSFIEFWVIGLIAFGLFLIPPIGNFSTNMAAMIITKIDMQFADEFTKEKINIINFRNEIKDKMSSKQYWVRMFEKGGASEEDIEKIRGANFDSIPPDDESLNLIVASRKSSEAFNYLRAGNYDRARSICEAIFWLKNDYAITWQYYGTALLMQGEIEAAISAFNNAKKYNPFFFPGYFMLSLAYMFLGKYDEARKIRSAGKFALNSSNARNLIDETTKFDKYGMFDDLHPGQSTDEFFNEYKKLVLDDDGFEKLLKEAKNVKWDSETIKKFAQDFVNFDIVNTQKYQRTQTAQLEAEFLSNQRL